MEGSRSWILHVDLDQFIAAVEVLRRPELRGRPVVVGGTGDATQRRMVVATASYEAREFGIRSGMPLRAAAKRCPDAVFLPTDPPTYEAASARVMATLRSMRAGGAPVVVEVRGWDEAFVGGRTDDPDALAREIRQAVLAETGLSCSVGIGDTLQRAKIATGFAKPAGISRLTSETWMEIMGHRSTEALWGLGPRTARRLRDAGITTVAELAAADPDHLAHRFGPRMGPWYRELALGGGDTAVSDEPWVARSRSREKTFPADLTLRSAIDAEVALMAAALTRDMAAGGRDVVRVAVKVRFASFFTQTKISKLPAATVDPDLVESAALALLDRFELDRPVRLLGVRVELAVPPADLPTGP